MHGEQSEEWVGPHCVLESDIVSGMIRANQDRW